MVDIVKTKGNRDDDRCNGQRIKESGQKSAGKTEKQSNHNFRLHPHKYSSEGELQKFLHEIDACNHKHQKKDNLKIRQCFVVNGFRFGHTHDNGFNGQKTARR